MRLLPLDAQSAKGLAEGPNRPSYDLMVLALSKIGVDGAEKPVDLVLAEGVRRPAAGWERAKPHLPRKPLKGCEGKAKSCILAGRNSEHRNLMRDSGSAEPEAPEGR